MRRRADVPGTTQQMHYDMEDLMEQANEVQESMSRTYGVPDEVDEADLEAGARSSSGSVRSSVTDSSFALQSSMRLEMTWPRTRKASLRTFARKAPSYPTLLTSLRWSSGCVCLRRVREGAS